VLPVALDVMGGDHAPGAQLEGAARAHAAGLPVLLVGDEARLRHRSGGLPLVHASQVVTMDDRATAPLRTKPDSSVRRAMEAARDGQAAAVVTCGHSGAAMASAMHVLRKLPGVERPALVTQVPRADGGEAVILDLGANIDCKPSTLACFARLGSAYASAMLPGVPAPRVGLLSNGEERSKGNAQIRAALPLLDALEGVRFVGPVEPAAVLRGDVDVLVCDGFAGNVMLKTVEATAELVGGVLKRELQRHPLESMGAVMLGRAFKRFRRRTQARNYGGALLVGIDGVVVVGHGRSDPVAVHSAVEVAAQCVERDLVGHVRRALAGACEQEPSR